MSDEQKAAQLGKHLLTVYQYLKGNQLNSINKVVKRITGKEPFQQSINWRKVFFHHEHLAGRESLQKAVRALSLADDTMAELQVAVVCSLEEVDNIQLIDAPVLFIGLGRTYVETKAIREQVAVIQHDFPVRFDFLEPGQARMAMLDNKYIGFTLSDKLYELVREAVAAFSLGLYDRPVSEEQFEEALQHIGQSGLSPDGLAKKTAKKKAWFNSLPSNPFTNSVVESKGDDALAGSSWFGSTPQPIINPNNSTFTIYYFQGRNAPDLYYTGGPDDVSFLSKLLEFKRCQELMTKKGTKFNFVRVEKPEDVKSHLQSHNPKYSEAEKEEQSGTKFYLNNCLLLLFLGNTGFSARGVDWNGEVLDLLKSYRDAVPYLARMFILARPDLINAGFPYPGIAAENDWQEKNLLNRLGFMEFRSENAPKYNYKPYGEDENPQLICLDQIDKLVVEVTEGRLFRPVL